MDCTLTTTTSPRPRVARRSRLRPRGFNFAEVLFAVMILGIGFIMIAAIFPVALTQTKTTGEQVVASTMGRGGVNYLNQLALSVSAYNNLFVTDLQSVPPDGPAAAAPAVPETIPGNGTRNLPGKMISFRDSRLDPAVRDALWRQISGNLILPDDPRNAWVAFYRRGQTYVNTTGGDLAANDPNPALRKNPDPFAHVVVIGVSARARSAFDAGKDLRRHNGGALADTPPATASGAQPGSLEGLMVYVKLTEGDAGPDLVSFWNDATGGARIENLAAAEGAYIVISDDQIADDPATTTVNEYNARNGRVYRLGAKRDDLGVGAWELSPDGDLTFINPDGTVGSADDVSEQIPPRPVTATPNVAPAGLPAVAFMVGRGYADPADPAAGYEGVAQDTGVYVSIIPAN